MPASPSRLAALRRTARAYLRGVAQEVTDDLILALHEAATNAGLHGSHAGQPLQVHVQVHDGWVEASVLEHGPQPPAGLPAAADPGERAGGRAGPVAAAPAGG
jgi:anti-sigma regulatory factor (Ser/Thr protein kinase)